MLELKHISYQVSDAGAEQTILNDVSVTIPDGELVVFTGPNGGGKTTLAKIIMGLVTPTGGEIIYNGKDITGLDITELSAAAALQGHHRPRPADHRLRRRQAVQGQVLPLSHAGGPVRQRLPRPRGGHVALRR